MEQTRKRTGCARLLLYAIGAAMLLCVLALAAIMISNQTLPPPPDQVERLTDLDRARLAEAVRLKDTLGDQVWPGWGEADIPIILWNSEYAFLFASEVQPEGWEALDGETFGGRPVYRRGDAEELSAFAEQYVEGQWAGSMSTKWETDNGFRAALRENLPAPLPEIIPYRLFILPTEVYMGGILHETFHAYQAMAVRDRFDDSEEAYPDEDRYFAADESMREAWRGEIGLLIDALNAESDAEAADLARQFLDARSQRRSDAGLDESLILYEQRFEWLEGLAKYIELGIYEAAAESDDYGLPESLADDPDFQNYDTWDQRWSSELISMRNAVSTNADSRFYYTGMAQARLLERLLSGWKDRIFEEGVWLEDLLAEAVG